MVDETVDLTVLNDLILKKKDRFLITIRNADRLIDMKKQLLLYNLLEWIKTDIKNQLGIVFVTRNFEFPNRFERRVKSRFTGK